MAHGSHRMSANASALGSWSHTKTWRARSQSLTKLPRLEGSTDAFHVELVANAGVQRATRCSSSSAARRGSRTVSKSWVLGREKCGSMDASPLSTVSTTCSGWCSGAAYSEPQSPWSPPAVMTENSAATDVMSARPPSWPSQSSRGSRPCRLEVDCDIPSGCSGADGRSPTSGLLARRQAADAIKCPLNIEVEKTKVSALLAVLKKTKPEREIRQLPADTKIYDLYSWDEVLQENGSGGKVVVCHAKGSTGGLSDTKLVMKMLSKKTFEHPCAVGQFRQLQQRMLNLPPHRGVMPILDVLEDEKYFYTIMEKASGGSFFDSLLRDHADGVMPAKEVRRVLREILGALAHVHQQGMLHRDIKPDNIVMHAEDGQTGSSIRLIDFDHADTHYTPDTPSFSTRDLGTYRFNAPETLRGEWSAASDLYSVGCILYLLMAGTMPCDDHIFDGFGLDDYEDPLSQWQWRASVYDRLRHHTIDFERSPWPEQQVCRDFCQSLLAFDPEQRLPSVEAALAHEWFPVV